MTMLRLVHDANVDGRPPPADPTAEASVLSAVLLDPAALPKIADVLQPQHFFAACNASIFEAALALQCAGQPIDPTSVGSWLHARGRLQAVGGAGYLADVIGASPAVVNVRAHAVAVHDCWRRRQAIHVCQRIAAEGYLGVGDVQRWCDGATRALGAIALANPLRPVETNEQTLSRILREAFGAQPEAAAAPRMTGYPTGIYGIDRLLGGMRRKAKTTIAATTGVGKTAFAAQVAVALAKQGVGVLFFSLELERQELLRRALAAESGVPATRIRDRRLTPADRHELVEATARLKALPWRIDESPRLTIEQIAAASKAMRDEMPIAHRVPLGMVVVDYVQRLEPSAHVARRERHEQVGHATRAFKILCQELDVIGLELAQAKDAHGGKRGKPRASCDIADSSQIAKESDDVVFLVAEGPAGDRDPRIEINAIVAKQRAGARGEVALMFRGDLFRFSDPNEPSAARNPSRQYVDPAPESNPLTEGL